VVVELLDRLREVVDKHHYDEDQDFIRACHEVLVELYPGLHLRWVRIYGKRWAYIYGNPGDIDQSPRRIQLSPDYGVCIDHAELVDHLELNQLIAIIKEHFNEQVVV